MLFLVHRSCLRQKNRKNALRSDVCFPLMMYKLEFCVVWEFHSFVFSDLVAKLKLKPDLLYAFKMWNLVGGSVTLCVVCCHVVLPNNERVYV